LSDVFNFGAAANELLRGARGASIGYVLWGVLHDSELEYARALMADLTEDQDLLHEAAMRRSEKLRAIGSQATFFSGLARIDEKLRSVRVAVTPQCGGAETARPERRNAARVVPLPVRRARP
jgi:hypothetical protein